MENEKVSAVLGSLNSAVALAIHAYTTRAKVPYHVEVTVKPTFIPAKVDASSGDVRELGAQVGFDFIPVSEAGG